MDRQFAGCWEDSSNITPKKSSRSSAGEEAAEDIIIEEDDCLEDAETTEPKVYHDELHLSFTEVSALKRKKLNKKFVGAHQHEELHCFHLVRTFAFLPDLPCPVYPQQSNKGSGLGPITLLDPAYEWQESTGMNHHIYDRWRAPVGGKVSEHAPEAKANDDGNMEQVFLHTLPGDVLRAVCGRFFAKCISDLAAGPGYNTAMAAKLRIRVSSWCMSVQHMQQVEKHTRLAIMMDMIDPQNPFNNYHGEVFKIFQKYVTKDPEPKAKAKPKGKPEKKKVKKELENKEDDGGVDEPPKKQAKTAEKGKKEGKQKKKASAKATAKTNENNKKHDDGSEPSSLSEDSDESEGDSWSSSVEQEGH